jgi:hypothetical protein
VLLEEGTIGRIPVDVNLFDVDVLLLQKTSGVSAGRSSGFPVEDGFGHGHQLYPPAPCRLANG